SRRTQNFSAENCFGSLRALRLLFTRRDADPLRRSRASTDTRRFRQGPRIQRRAAADEDVLSAIELIRDRRGADAADRRAPDARALGGRRCTPFAGRGAGEGLAVCRRQPAGAGGAFAEMVMPAPPTGLVVERAHPAPAEHAVIGARPAVGAVVRLEKIDP